MNMLNELPTKEQKRTLLSLFKGKLPKEWIDVLRESIQDNFTNHFSPEENKDGRGDVISV